MNIERKTYDKDIFAEIMYQIRQVVSEYKFRYNREPLMIILSPNLITGFKYTNPNFLDYNPLNNIHTIFGIECKESPVLCDLEYKVY